MNIKHRIGYRIREIRQQRQMSQEQLAQICQLDRTYINSVENGRRNVSIVNIERIAQALEISLAIFFDTEGFKNLD